MGKEDKSTEVTSGQKSNKNFSWLQTFDPATCEELDLSWWLKPNKDQDDTEKENQIQLNPRLLPEQIQSKSYDLFDCVAKVGKTYQTKEMEMEQGKCDNSKLSPLTNEVASGKKVKDFSWLEKFDPTTCEELDASWWLKTNEIQNVTVDENQMQLSPKLLSERIKSNSYDLFDCISKDEDNYQVFLQQVEDAVDKILHEDFDDATWKKTLGQRLGAAVFEMPDVFESLQDMLEICIEFVYTFPPVDKEPQPGSSSQTSSSDNNQGIQNKSTVQRLWKTLWKGQNDSTIRDDNIENEDDMITENETDFSSPTTYLALLPLKDSQDLIMNVLENARVELDIFISTCSRIVEVLYAIRRKMLKMNVDQFNAYELGENLDGESILHLEFLKMMYSSDRIKTGLHKYPVLFISKVLKRLEVLRSRWVNMYTEWNECLKDKYRIWIKTIEKMKQFNLNNDAQA